MQVNPLIQVALALRQALGPFARPPLSAVTVLLISVMMALVTNLVNRHFIDYERLRRYREEINKWQAMRREAETTTDERVRQKLLLRVKRRERYIMRLQSEVGKQTMKPMMVTFIPFMLTFLILNGVFIDDTTFPWPVYAPVVISPLNFGSILGFFGLAFGWSYGQYPGIPPGGQGLFFVWWYVIVSFAANLMFQRIFKTGLT